LRLAPPPFAVLAQLRRAPLAAVSSARRPSFRPISLQPKAITEHYRVLPSRLLRQFLTVVERGSLRAARLCTPRSSLR
jgi:hypothetical protein